MTSWASLVTPSEDFVSFLASVCLHVFDERRIKQKFPFSIVVNMFTNMKIFHNWTDYGRSWNGSSWFLEKRTEQILENFQKGFFIIVEWLKIVYQSLIKTYSTIIFSCISSLGENLFYLKVRSALQTASIFLKLWIINAIYQNIYLCDKGSHVQHETHF